MLTQLSIRNVVLIEKADLPFENGLCVLTGETGAGKSILLDALGLALGARTDASLIRKGADAASVTAEFDLDPAHAVFPLLEEAGVEAETPLILRRQLSADGKSRAFVNDQTVSLKTLREIGERLIEIHGQHEQHFLNDMLRQEQLLDAYAATDKQLVRAAAAYALWQQKRRELNEINASLEQALKEREYLEHMERELSQLRPVAGEEEELSSRRAHMMQSEKLASTLDEALSTLQQPKPVIDALRSAERILTRCNLPQNALFEPAIALLDQSSTALQEAEAALEAIGQESAYSAPELETIEERLFALKDVARKYRLPVDELPALYQQVREKLSTLKHGNDQKHALEKEIVTLKAAYLEAAQKLSEQRQKAAARLEKALAKELTPLKMESTRFRVAFNTKLEEQWTARGIDRIQFEAAINKGSDFATLSGIASGGELSRFMLALAVVLGKASGTATMIFDEIDTGTGGAVADAIGRRLEALGELTQVLVVTHLPQVAARGREHFVVSKEETKKMTMTAVRKLSSSEKREELARMLSGAEITEEARKAADRLLAGKDKHAA